jgi:hypothetical protein
MEAAARKAARMSIAVLSGRMREASNIFSVLDTTIGALAALGCDGSDRFSVMCLTEGTSQAACTGTGRDRLAA